MSEVLLVGIVLLLFASIAVPAVGVLDHTAERPNVAVRTSYDAGTGTLSVTHLNGDGFDGGRVHFVGADGTSLGTWGEGRVEVGDRASVAVSPGETVRLVWRSPDGRTELLLVWTGAG